MTMAVRNSDSEMITELGGLCCRPSAVRSSDSTTTMRTNEVVMITIDGRQRQHGHQADQLHHPVGQAGAGAEVDVHRLGQRRRPGRSGWPGRGQRPPGRGAAPLARRAGRGWPCRSSRIRRFLARPWRAGASGEQLAFAQQQQPLLAVAGDEHQPPRRVEHQALDHRQPALLLGPPKRAERARARSGAAPRRPGRSGRA